jgi:hypothetical protein
MSERLETALRWAAQGVPVFPAGLGKQPLVEHGFYDATIDPAQIRVWWERDPGPNIAIPTGRPSGLVVVDVDDYKGGSHSLFELEREHGKLLPTTSAVTPRGGEHFYFRWPRVAIKTTADVIAPGIDIRGDGGYVLISPSATGDGSYEWDERRQPAQMPTWLLELTRADRDNERAAAPPDQWARMLRDGIADGSRNVDLTSLTGYLLRRYIHVDVAAELVHLVNEHRVKPPKARSEVDLIIDSIAGRELRRRERRTK